MGHAATSYSNPRSDLTQHRNKRGSLTKHFAVLQRANVYSPLISVFTLRTKEPASKWTLASVALLMQDELS